jgi:hypothetical protein
VGGIVVDRIAGHRTDDTELVCDAADLRKDFADFRYKWGFACGARFP